MTETPKLLLARAWARLRETEKTVSPTAIPTNDRFATSGTRGYGTGS